MSSSDRRTFLRHSFANLAGLTLGGTALAGCGFVPAYSTAGGGLKLMQRVRTDDPKTRDDFYFVRRMSERIGPNETPRYRLGYKITTNVIGEAITPENATTRYSLTGNVDYTLHDGSTDAVLLTGRAASFTSWSAASTVVSTDSAEEDAHRRLMRILADQVVTRLLAQASSLPE